MRLNRDTFVSATRKAHGAEAIAGWLERPLERLRPVPSDRAGLVITHRGPRLCVPGAAPLYWSPGLTPRRLARGAADIVPRALELTPGETVLDGTLGMGFDALVLANAGARVIGWERQRITLYFTADGLWRYRPDLARRIHVAHIDTELALPQRPANSVDHVFLDPMFPAGGRAPNLAPLRGLAVGGRPNLGLIEHARRVARRWVLLRLAPGEDPPAPDAEVIASKRVRYARWPAV